MRQIKFRAWDVDRKEMVAINGLQFNNEGIKLIRTYQKFNNLRTTDHLIPMQFTGLLDKNGKEIYEGDVIDNESATQKYEVIFHKGCFCISRGGLGYHIFDEKKVEVLGNIYENPNLLK